jgi:hypothetical protein
MSKSDKDIDWLSVDEAVCREILAQGEKRLASQLSIALASDTRALTSAGIFFGVAVALCGFALNDIVNNKIAPLSVSALTAGALLFVSVWLLAYAARPVDFYVPGNEPKNWFLALELSLKELIGSETKHYDDMIAENENILRNNEIAVRNAFKIALAAPIFALHAFGSLTYSVG